MCFYRTYLSSYCCVACNAAFSEWNISGKSKGKSQGLYYLYLEAVSIKNSKSLSMPNNLQDSNDDVRATELFDIFSFSPRDLEFVVKFSQEHGSDVFCQILHSICPSIYGHELVKGNVLFIYILFSFSKFVLVPGVLQTFYQTHRYSIIHGQQVPWRLIHNSCNILFIKF